MGGLRVGGAVRAVVLRGVLGAVVRLPGAFWELQSSAKDMLGAVVLRGCGAEPHPPVSPAVFGAIPVSAPRRPLAHSSVCHLRLSHTAPSRPPRPPPWDGMGSAVRPRRECGAGWARGTFNSRVRTWGEKAEP